MTTTSSNSKRCIGCYSATLTNPKAKPNAVFGNLSYWLVIKADTHKIDAVGISIY